VLRRIEVEPGHRGPTVALTARQPLSFRNQSCVLLVQALDVVAKGPGRGMPRDDLPFVGTLRSGIGLVHILCNEAGITDEVTLAAALLHHCLLQTSLGYMDLRRQFGPLVADLVCELDESGAVLLPDRPLSRSRAGGVRSHRARMILLATAIMGLRHPVGERHDPLAWRDPAALNTTVASLRGTHATLEVLFDQELARVAARG
jgi:hypothetical protein